MQCFYSFFRMREYLKHAKCGIGIYWGQKQRTDFMYREARWENQRNACLMALLLAEGRYFQV